MKQRLSVAPNDARAKATLGRKRHRFRFFKADDLISGRLTRAPAVGNPVGHAQRVWAATRSV